MRWPPVAKSSDRSGYLEAAPRRAVWTFGLLAPAERGEVAPPSPQRVERLELEIRRLRDIVETFGTMLSAAVEPCPSCAALDRTEAA